LIGLIITRGGIPRGFGQMIKFQKGVPSSLLQIRPISFETPIGEEEDSRLRDLIEDKEVISPQEAAINSNMTRQIQKVLCTLTKREDSEVVVRDRREEGPHP
jgi:DNA-directed RNA polymerase sigma subunit (sigma70/sigma32)